LSPVRIWPGMVAALVLCAIGVALGYLPFSGLVSLLVMMAAAGVVPAVFVLLWLWPSRPVPSIDGTRLIQRREPGKILAEIDLSLPFRAECVFHSDERAFLRVKQGRTTMRFAARLSENDGLGHLIRDVLRLQWPPQARIVI